MSFSINLPAAEADLDASQGNRKDRVNWIDSSRGIGIILVVVGHSLGGLIASHLGNNNYILSVNFNLIYSFHMALFFFLSGIFTPVRLERKGGAFLSENFYRLFHPYLFWGTIQIVVILVAGQFANTPLTFAPILFVQILWEPPSQFWFLYSLFIMHALALFFYRYSNFKVMFLMSLLFQLAPSILLLPTILTDVARYWIFYSTAILVARMVLDRGMVEKMNWQWWIIIAVLWVVAVFVGVWGGGFQSLWNLPAAFLGTIVVIRASAFEPIAHNRALGFLGRRSMPIFLTHVLIVAGVRILFINIFHVQNVYLIIAVASFLGLVLPCILYYFAEKRGLAKLLALR